MRTVVSVVFVDDMGAGAMDDESSSTCLVTCSTIADVGTVVVADDGCSSGSSVVDDGGEGTASGDGDTSVLSTDNTSVLFSSVVDPNDGVTTMVVRDTAASPIEDASASSSGVVPNVCVEMELVSVGRRGII